jgi:hypothetical protein
VAERRVRDERRCRSATGGAAQPRRVEGPVRDGQAADDRAATGGGQEGRAVDRRAATGSPRARRPELGACTGGS